jgi:Tfp pilus assembly protein PilO
MRVVLGIAVVACAVAAAWTLVIAPQRQDAARLGVEVRQAADQLRDANERAGTAAQARATYARDYATVARLGKAVPITTDVPSLVIQLETAARRAKVDFRSITASDPPAQTPGAAPANGGIQPAPFSFRFIGDYFAMQRLLAEIDRFSRVQGTKVAVSGRLLTIDGVMLNPKSVGKRTVQGTVTARAYVADMPEALPGATPTQTSTPASEATP